MSTAATKPVWNGYMAIGLVNLAVKAFKATDSSTSETAMKTLHAKCKAPINTKKICTPCNVTLGEGDTVRGYEVSKGVFVVMTDEEIASIKSDTSETIAIDAFVPAASIDSIFVDSFYYLGPETQAAAVPYAMVRDAMIAEQRVAVGRLSIYGREHQVSVRPHGRALAMQILRTNDEVRNPETMPLFSTIPGESEQSALKLARQLVTMLAGDFDPTAYEDGYVAAFHKVVDAKRDGVELTPQAAGTKAAPVLDFMSLLKASLETPAAPKAKKLKVAKVVEPKAPKGKKSKAA